MRHWYDVSWQRYALLLVLPVMISIFQATAFGRGLWFAGDETTFKGHPQSHMVQCPCLVLLQRYSKILVENCQLFIFCQPLTLSLRWHHRNLFIQNAFIIFLIRLHKTDDRVLLQLKGKLPPFYALQWHGKQQPLKKRHLKHRLHVTTLLSVADAKINTHKA